MKKILWVCFVTLMTTRGYGALLPDSYQREDFSDFSGGLNTLYPSHKIPNNFSPYMRNVKIDDGIIERTKGYTVLGSSSSLQKVTGIFPYVLEDGSAQFFVTDSSITIATQDFQTYTFISSGSNTSSLLNWMQVRNKMWGFNGLDNVMVSAGTAAVKLDGTNGTPNVPKFKYGVFFQDRVWGFSIPNGASDLYFSSIISTDALALAPDDARAWPVINAIYIGRGDGTIGTGLFVYQGQLRIAKEKSLYTLYGDDETSFTPRKEETKVGVISNDSVVDMDGEVHYLSKDGIYRNLNRISDLIYPDVQNINKNTSRINTNIWDTSDVLSRGQYEYTGTTITQSGLVTISTQDIVFDYVKQWVAGSSVNINFTIPGSGSTGYFSLSFVPSTSVASGFWPLDTVLWLKKGLFNCDLQQIRYKYSVMNTFTGESSTSTIIILPNNTTEVTLSTYTPKFTYAQALAGGIAIKLMQTEGVTASPCGDAYSGNPHLGRFTMSIATETIAQYTSEVASNTTITQWSGMESERNTNTGTIIYYYRTSTSVVNITTQAWTPITPGGQINAPTQNKFIQWASTLTMISTVSVPFIDNVTISHIEGQSSESRAFGIDWDNRYWLAVTTTTDNTKRLIYVKSKNTNQNPNAWMPVEGIPISCFAKYGDVLYAGSASTGSVYRLDYGTNYNGTAIRSVYDTPDIIAGDNYFDKNLQIFTIDGEKQSGGTMGFAYSLNNRDYSDKSFSIDGSGRFSRVVEGVRDNGQFKTLRMKFYNEQLDIPLKINNFSFYYTPSRVLTNK